MASSKLYTCTNIVWMHKPRPSQEVRQIYPHRQKHSADGRRLKAVVGNCFNTGEPQIPLLGLKSSVGMTILQVTTGNDGEYQTC